MTGRAGSLVALALGGAAVITAIVIWRRPGDSHPRPSGLNVILITIDALRADHMGLYGYPHDTTPNIDRFADDAIVFRNAFCTIPKTTGSVATIMTGLHPFIHGVAPSNDHIPSDLGTLAQVFNRSGYRTTAVVDNANLSRAYDFARGFDTYTEVWRAAPVKSASTAFINRTVLQFLGQDRPKPFFLWVHYVEPHTPFVPPSNHIHYDPSVKGRDLRTVPATWIRPQIYARSILDSATPYEGYLIALYDGTIRYVDEAVAEILQVIERRYRGNTVVIISADHGEDLGEHNLFIDHGMLSFTTSTRVPLILRFPGQSARVVTDPVSLMDIYPTLVGGVLGRQPQAPGSTASLLSPIPARRLYLYASQSHAIVDGTRYYTLIDDQKLAESLHLASRYCFDIADGTDRTVDVQAILPQFDRAEADYQELHRQHPYPRRGSAGSEAPDLPAEDRENLKTLGYLE
ncbi:MAG: sulfatase [Acidobacteria bacterium]|nr:sulfatase [Acidobacteriota bacterium]